MRYLDSLISKIKLREIKFRKILTNYTLSGKLQLLFNKINIYNYTGTFQIAVFNISKNRYSLFC